MPDLPSGAVTFLFTDIEGSTRLVRQLRGRYAEVLAEHQRLREAFATHGGHEIDTAAPVNGRYTGLAVHRAARICAAGHGGQILVSQATQSLLEQAFESLSRADREAPLGAEDLELLARSVYMLGRDDDYRAALERAYHSYLDAGDHFRAARCTWWIGRNLLFQGEAAPASGWFARGQRLLERGDRECVERGYLLIPVLLQHAIGADFEAAYSTAVDVAEIGERFGDRDLVAIA